MAKHGWRFANVALPEKASCITFDRAHIDLDQATHYGRSNSPHSGNCSLRFPILKL